MKRKTRNFRRCRLEAYIDFPDLPKSFDWNVVNVSPEGCQLVGNLDFHINETVRCVFTVPEKALETEIDSKVVWKSGNRYGLEFLNFPEGQKLYFAMAIYGARKAA